MSDTMLSTHHARNGLLQWLLFVLALGMLLYVFRQSLAQLEVVWSQTLAGLLINGFIGLLFTVGMLRILWLLYFYQREETAIRQFMHHWVSKQEIHGQSLIAARYFAMQSLHSQQTPVHQGALAAALQAREKARTSVLRYINNVLILCGVFGTIVSLSIALVGASGMLEGAVDAKGMGMVIHGMSSALSTTMTAIACYFFFHYFLLQVENARLAVLASIEHISSTLLAPVFHIQADRLPHQLSALLQTLQESVQGLAQAQQQWLEQQQQVQQRVEKQLAQLDHYLEQCTAFIPATAEQETQSRQLELQLYRTLKELREQQQQAQQAQLEALKTIAAQLQQGFRLPSQ